MTPVSTTGPQRVVELGRLRDARRRDHVHRLRHACSGRPCSAGRELAAAQTPNWKSCGVGWKPRAWSELKPSWPVSTTVKPQPGPGVPERRLRHAEGDEARDRVARDRRPCRAVAPCGVDVALAEALHLDQPAPRRRRPRSCSCASRERRGGRGRRRARDVHVDVDELRAERAAEGRRQVARLDAEDDVAAAVDRPGSRCRSNAPGVEVVGRSDRRSCPGRCRRRSGRSTSSSTRARRRSRRRRCAWRARSPPLGLTATTLSTVVPAGDRRRATLKEPSAPAVVDAVRRRRVRVGVRRRRRRPCCRRRSCR